MDSVEKKENSTEGTVVGTDRASEREREKGRERERLIPGNRLNYSRVRNRIMAEARIWLSRVWLTNAARANRFIVPPKSCFNSDLRESVCATCCSH